MLKRGIHLQIKMTPLKCIGCKICEFACSYYRDSVFTTVSSSLMLHREEKKNYFGMMQKREQDLVLGRPEGIEIQGAGEGGEASAKPILTRVPCDLCKGGEALCVIACPTGSLELGD